MRGARTTWVRALTIAFGAVAACHASDAGPSSNAGGSGTSRYGGGNAGTGTTGGSAQGGNAQSGSAQGGGAQGGTAGLAGGSHGGSTVGGAAGEPGSSGASASGAGGEAGSGGGSAPWMGPLDVSGIDPSALSDKGDPPGLADARTRAAAIAAGLSQSEKLALVQGSYGAYVGNVSAVTGVPALSLQDGPAGVARFYGVTAFPAPITLAASWDRDLVEQWGAAMAAEERGKGVMIQLGPMMNLARTPFGGRNFEGFGEDPFLAAELAARDVSGIQSQKVVATAKHFVGNEQETNRMLGDSRIDERTLHEVYYAPFAASVRAGAGAVMCSYNLLNGVYACENPTSLADLKTTFGFSGFVMSDWSATHSTDAAANAGLDMEMPYGSYFTALASSLSAGTVPQARLDDMVLRILTSLAQAGVLDDPPSGTTTTDVTSSAHTDIARQGASEGITLLKNDANLLPLDLTKTVVVIGAAGDSAPVAVGGGSAAVNPPYIVSPLSAMQLRAGSSNVSAVNGALASITAAAAAADVALVFADVASSEGVDRSTLSTSLDATIAAVAAVNPNTIVVLNVPGAVLMPWLDQVRAVLVAWYPGQENGNAISSVLYGDTNPGGKLPVTFPASASDLPIPLSSSLEVDYSEGLAIGYRALDAANTAPLFPFGYGLSYTHFDYSALELGAGSAPGALRVSFELTNSGSRDGSEVAELYLSYPDSAGEPPRVLRGFQRVTLAAGETESVAIELTPLALSCWSATAHARYVPSGSYRVSVGGSSRDLPLTAAFDVNGVGP